MDMFNTLLFIILIFEQKAKSVGKQAKLIYEKDISEHCRRHVMPSIFLGREVIDANARIVQFSRLELPYSCYVSVRTESGSSIVMMLQVTSPDLREACKNSAQLLVYEMGETFGGYWGPLPDAVYDLEPAPPKPYTLKTTRYPITTITKSTEEERDEEEETTAKQTPTASRQGSREPTTGDYVEVEMPLVNVSVRYVPDDKSRFQPLESDLMDTFDMHHDVTPIPGVPYESSILPLVQFRLVDELPARRNDDNPNGEVPKYDLDIVEDFTPDIRLTLPQLNPTSKRRQKQRYQSTRLLTFKKHRTLFHSQRHSHRRMIAGAITRKLNDVTKYSFPTTKGITKEKQKHTEDSWRVIDDLLKKLNKTELESFKTTMSVKDVKLLERISNTDHNKSAYLSSKLSEYGSDTINVTSNHITGSNTMNGTTKLNYTILSTKKPASLITSATEKSSTKDILTEELTLKTSYTKFKEIAAAQTVTGIENTVDNDKISDRSNLITESLPTAQPLTLSSNSTQVLLVDSTTQTDDVLRKNSESENLSSTTTKSTSTEKLADQTNKQNSIVTGSMVGHESWENLVQAAPEMAVFLNQTAADVIRGNTSDDITKETTEAPHKNEMLKRKKRHIHSIAIDNAQPHSITTKKIIDTTTELSFNIADMQEFAQLVELQDDELQGRVALRQLHQLVGPPLFNLCDISDLSKAQVHLFNSSRIVLAPTNFSLERMVLVLTAARALLSGELRCPKNMIECQVAGARVCLDSMVACDGVPNCGSYGDVYDEDRLLCGHMAAMQYNVYLAAFTFLAVLLTSIYAVHYWLKRCVPQVADAFFVYSDGVENILYLDSIMRSPHDMGDDPKMMYHSHMYDDDIYEDIAPPRKNACLRCLRKICCCCCRKTKKLKSDKTLNTRSDFDPPVQKKMYSFTELEISKMAAAVQDTAVQTGDSLELRPLEQAKEKQTLPAADREAIRTATTSYDFSVKITDSLLTLEEPLPEMQSDELNILKFLKSVARSKRRSSIDLQTDMVESTIRSQAQKKPPESQSGIYSPSERELRIHTYDRPGILEPGASLRKLDDNGQVSPSSSVSKHLRFDEVTTTIPPGRYSDDGDTNIVEGRRTVALVDRSHRLSRLLDTIEEADEQSSSTKEHFKSHFWGSSKLKKPKKKTHVSLR